MKAQLTMIGFREIEITREQLVDYFEKNYAGQTRPDFDDEDVWTDLAYEYIQDIELPTAQGWDISLHEESEVEYDG